MKTETVNELAVMYAGSIAYGTNLPTSDVDKRGIYVGTPTQIRTPFFPANEFSMPNEEDGKLFELNKFMALCVACNPNVVELLWTDEADIISQHPAYSIIRDQREALLNKNIANTTCGYAMSQLKRIKGHNKWINNPQPTDPPKQIDYVSLVHNFTARKIFKIDMRDIQDGYALVPYGGDLYGVYESKGSQTYSNDYTLNTNGEHRLDVNKNHPLFLVKFNQSVYKDAKMKHSQYWTWKTNRNESRSKLEEDFGYDTKHAMHLVRLLQMGMEALTTGQLFVKRPDNTELLAIRHGELSYTEILEYANYLENKIKEAKHQTQLPDKPNFELASKLILEVQDEMWK